jgi:hypothetical protein
MKAITKNLIYFSIFFFIGAIIFRFGLSYFLQEHAYTLVWILAGSYFLFNFLIGWIFGKRDYESLPLFDVGFRFHFVTYILYNSVALAWFYMELQAPTEKVGSVYITALTWGVLLLMHFVLYLYAQKQSIKGINRDEIFE